MPSGRWRSGAKDWFVTPNSHPIHVGGSARRYNRVCVRLGLPNFGGSYLRRALCIVSVKIFVIGVGRTMHLGGIS